MPGLSKIYFFIFYVLVVACLVISQYPVVFKLPGNDLAFLPNAYVFSPVQGDGVAQYRIDESRTGASPAAGPTRGRWKRIPPDLNSGIHGASKSSPIGFGEDLFIGSDEGSFWALHKLQKKWRYYFPSSFRGIHSSALVVGNGACIGTYHGFFYCMERDTGELLWFRRVGHTVGAAPLVVGEVIYLSVETTRFIDGYFLALNKRNGTELWRSVYLGEQSHSSPSYDPKTQMLVGGANNNKFFGLDSKTGEIKWDIDLGGPVKSTAAIHNSIAYITSWSGHLYAVNVRDGDLLWSVDLGGKSQSSPTLLRDGKSLIVSSAAGAIFVIDITKGSIRKTFPWEGPAWQSIKPSALALENSVWMPCGDKKICLFDRTASRLIDSFSLPGLVSGVPWYQGGRIYVATESDGALMEFSSENR